MARVVALELVPRPGLVQRVQGIGDVLERIAEHEIAGVLQHLRFPIEAEILEPLQHREQAEIHRSHVQTRNFRLPDRRRCNALLDRHEGRSAGGQIHHHIGALFDLAQERDEGLRSLIRTPIHGISRMQMHDRRAGPGRADGGLGDLPGRHGKPGRHRRRVDRTGDGAGDDDFPGCHGLLTSVGRFRDRARLRCAARSDFETVRYRRSRANTRCGWSHRDRRAS